MEAMFDADTLSFRRHQRVGNLLTLMVLAMMGCSVLCMTSDQIQLEPDDIMYEGDPCVMQNQTRGICRPANQCTWAMQKPWPISELVTCSFNMSLPIVCCPVGHDTRSVGLPVAKRISETQCEQYPNSTSLSDHILNGVVAQFGEFPHMAALAYDAPKGEESDGPHLFLCAANLISPRFLLTAAHCLKDRPSFARLGVIELQPVRTVDPPLDIAILNQTLHPDYNPITYHNDIALLELAEPVTGDLPYVDPICLYTSVDTLDTKQTLSVQGWGTQLPGDVEPAKRLMKANVTIVSREECRSLLPPSRRTRNGLHQGQLCALGRDERKQTVTDTCKGDSGGPLELVVDGRHYLVGITSTGFNCGSPIPGIYTEVARYLNWIESIVWPST
uniref:Peptidase S1 domain-containing protein n=1 Tax=Anopheles farauti TaxID=69004 RepID=A0A182Q4J1_9DIPT